MRLFARLLLVILTINLIIIPAISNPNSESERIDKTIVESIFRVNFFLKFDLIGKGEADNLAPAVLWEISVGEISTSAIIFTERNKDGVVRRELFKSYTFSGPATGVLMFFRGTVEYDPENETVEIHGSAIMGLSVS